MPTYTPSPSAVFRQVDDQIIALHLESGEYFTMNAVAARMWTLLTATHSIDETVTAIIDEYDVTREQVERELAQLITDLAANDLIVVA